mmetsp:Transcript_25175/g.42134  ORF Transcript_25175/g.42134 Transcript_25175/m.42134 type:complete len:205 (+) Transcript_25175:3993-4607(+)
MRKSGSTRGSSCKHIATSSASTTRKESSTSVQNLGLSGSSAASLTNFSATSPPNFAPSLRSPFFFFLSSLALVSPLPTASEYLGVVRRRFRSPRGREARSLRAASNTSSARSASAPAFATCCGSECAGPTRVIPAGGCSWRPSALMVGEHLLSQVGALGHLQRSCLASMNETRDVGPTRRGSLLPAGGLPRTFPLRCGLYVLNE